ncbi:MAG: AsmA-like C-terminal domain-containing protein, partial [Thermodesulfobacteriota bacterium]
LKDDLRHIESIKGSAFFSFLNFKGPVNDSEKWEIGAEGNINTVELGLQGLDTDMTISEAQIKTTTQELAITETTVDIKDSKMTVGAVLTNYLTDWLKLQMDFYGNMLAEEAKVFSDYFNVPTQLNFNSPVEIAESNIVLKKKPAVNSQVVVTQLTPNGTPVTKELDLNINIVAGSMNWADSEPKAPTQQPANELPPAAPGVSEEKKSKTALNGKVNIKSDHFEFKGYNWDTVKAEVAFLENQIDVNVNQANLCGISTPGVLEVASPTLKLQFEPFSEEANLAEAIKCLFDKAGIITGDFDFGGTLNSNSDIEDVLMAIEGELEMTSSEGRVSKYGGLARFLSALNFGEMFRGNNIDYEDGGFPYEFIKASANIEEGKLIIREAAMDGPSLKVVCDGSVDLINNQVDLKVIVIPVLAVDSVIEKIPIISMLLGKDVVSIPIRVTGDISDPTIEELSPHTIGAGLLGIIKQTLNIPVTLVKPLNSGKKKETTETDPAEVAGESTDE